MGAAVYSLTEGYTPTNYVLGSVLLARGEAKAVIAVLEPALLSGLEASNLYVTRTEIYEALGDAYAAAGDRARARDARSRAAAAWSQADPPYRVRASRAARLAGTTNSPFSHYMRSVAMTGRQLDACVARGEGEASPRRGSSPMRRRTIPLVLVLLIVVAPALLAHDLFLKLTSFFLAPQQHVTATVLNGTFTTSENAITRDRLRDIALVSGGTRQRLDTSAWTSTPDNKRSRVSFNVGAAGTYVLGASTRPRVLALPGKDFNAYLREEGLTDVLEARRSARQLADSSRERYSKHVKAMFQVGEARTNDYRVTLLYPAEIVPQVNPYSLRVGDELAVKCLASGSPVAGVAVLAGGTTGTGARIAPQAVRTDADGIARVKVTARGIWYVKFIKMERVTGDSVNYESRWATLTFAVR